MKHLHNDSDVVCVRGDVNLREAARTMNEREIGSLVVTDADDRVVGIVTDRDLCLRAVRWDRDPDETTVESVMSKDVAEEGTGRQYVLILATSRLLTFSSRPKCTA